MSTHQVSSSVHATKQKVVVLFTSILPALLLLSGLFTFFYHSDTVQAGAKSDWMQPIIKPISNPVLLTSENLQNSANSLQPFTISSRFHVPVSAYQQTNEFNPINISNSVADSENPCLTADTQGTPNFVWEEEGEILYKGLGGTTYNLSNSPTADSMFPSMAIGGNGTIHVVWRETFEEDPNSSIAYSEIYYSRSANGGQTWSTPIDLSTPYVYSTNEYDWGYSPQIAITSDDLVHIVWEHRIYGGSVDFHVHNGLLHRSFDGETWSAITIIADWIYGTATGLDVAVANTSLHVVHAGGYVYQYVYYLNRGSNGWSTENQLGYGGSPSIAAESSSDIHVTWKTNLESTDYIKYVRSETGGASWGSLENIDSTSEDDVLAAPDIVAANGTIRVLWFQEQALVFSQKEEIGWAIPTTLVDASDQPTGNRPCKHFIGNSSDEHIVYSAEIDSNRDVYYIRVVPI